jgi:hypothetical protein
MELQVGQQQIEWLFRVGSQGKCLLDIPGRVSPMTETAEK